MRRHQWTSHDRDRFIDALKRGSTVAEAVAETGLAVATAYRLRRREPAFARAWERAIRPASDTPAFEPVPRAARANGWTPERQAAFVDALEDYGSVAAAARAVGMTPDAAYRLRRAPGAESFARAWDEALAKGLRVLVDTTMDRAIHGAPVPVFQGGRKVGERRQFNDRLAMFHMSRRLPDQFGPPGPGAFAQANARAPGEAAPPPPLPRLPLTGIAAVDAAKDREEQSHQMLEEIRSRLERFHVHWRDALAREGQDKRDAYRLLFGDEDHSTHVGLAPRMSKLPPPLCWALAGFLVEELRLDELAKDTHAGAAAYAEAHGLKMDEDWEKGVAQP